MILVDTSIWIGHLRKGNHLLSSLLEDSAVLTHECIIGELACGSMRNRREILELLESLPRAAMAANDEVRHLVESRRLYGRGIGWVDAQLLASAIMSDAVLWTADRKLHDIAKYLEISYGAQ